MSHFVTTREGYPASPGHQAAFGLGVMILHPSALAFFIGDGERAVSASGCEKSDRNGP